MRRSQRGRLARLEKALVTQQKPFYEAVVVPFGCDRATSDRLIAEAEEAASRRGVPLVVSAEPAPTITAWVEWVHRDMRERGLE